MSQEATVQYSLNIRVGNPLTGLPYQDWRSNPTQYKGNVTSGKGPTPGLQLAAAWTPGIPGSSGAITQVSLAQLSRPGHCRVENLGRADGVLDDSYCEWGVYDTSTTKFMPVGCLKVGEFFGFYFSPNFGEKEDTPGTGTTATSVITFALRAFRSAQNIKVEAFEA